MGKMIDKIKNISNVKKEINQVILEKNGKIISEKLRDLPPSIETIPVIANNITVKLLEIQEYKILQDSPKEQSKSSYPNLEYATNYSLPSGEWAIMLIGSGGNGGDGNAGVNYDAIAGGGGGGAGYIRMLYLDNDVVIKNIVTNSKGSTSANINGVDYFAKKGGDGGYPYIRTIGDTYDIRITQADGGNGSAGGGIGGMKKSQSSFRFSYGSPGTGNFGGDGGDSEQDGFAFGHTNALGRNENGGRSREVRNPGEEVGAGGGGGGYAGWGGRASGLSGGGGGGGYAGMGGDGGDMYQEEGLNGQGFGSGGGGGYSGFIVPHQSTQDYPGGQGATGAVIIFKVIRKEIIGG